ncbi:MAG TPA: DUF3047 domain-containing protein [Ramlibacter sp.]|nr:DUF3047 domain-containing protein [Ramlibacter sp.]
MTDPTHAHLSLPLRAPDVRRRGLLRLPAALALLVALVVESGAERSGRWLAYERDLRADFERAFGEAPGPIISVGVLTDSDDLKVEVDAWYGDIGLFGA